MKVSQGRAAGGFNPGAGRWRAGAKGGALEGMTGQGRYAGGDRSSGTQGRAAGGP